MRSVIGHWSLVMVLLMLAGCAPRSQGGGPPAVGEAARVEGTRSISPGTYGEAGGIPVGAYVSLTGDIATFGQSTARGMIMAVDEINGGGTPPESAGGSPPVRQLADPAPVGRASARGSAPVARRAAAKGGALGKRLRLIIEDNLSKPDQVQPSVRKLIEKDRVCAVLGEVASTFSLVGAAICEEARVPMITPSSTNPAVTEGKDYVFRICFIDTFQGAVMARFARDNLKAQTSAILTDRKSDYSKGLREFYQRHFEALGGRIVADEFYEGGDKDFSIQLGKIKRANPDVIYIPGYYTECALIARTARQLDMHIPLVGGDGWDSPRTVDIAGAAADNTYFSNHYSKDEPAPVVQEFVANYKKRWGEVPDALAACGYDAVYVLRDALERAKTTEASALRDAIAATRDFHGVTGTITLDANHNAVKPAVVLKIEKGQQVYVTTIQPDQV